MNEPQPTSEASPRPPPPPDPHRRETVLRIIQEMLDLIGIQGKFESRDEPDGGINVALTLAEELPPAPGGRRSHVVESLQFLVNKITNRPGVERRWVSIGSGQFAAARVPRPEKPAGPRPERSPAPRPQQSLAAPAPAAPAATAPRAPRVDEERSVEVPDDPALTAAVRALAEQSSKLGRYYAIAPMRLEDRARTLKGTAAIAGVSVKVEGEGRARRVVFVPAKPAPMPKRAMPHDEDEE